MDFILYPNEKRFMHLDENLLISNGAVLKSYKKNELIYREGEKPKFFFQIHKGEVKLFNISSDSKEFTQGVISDGNTFGEPPVFLDKPYAVSAIATRESQILRMPREKFIQFLEKHPSLHMTVIYTLAQRFYSRLNVLKELMNNNPEERILNFLQSFKARSKKSESRVVIPYTRQEIANFTGLRVETVIRTLKRMEEKNLVEIKSRKLYF